MAVHGKPYEVIDNVFEDGKPIRLKIKEDHSNMFDMLFGGRRWE